MRVNSQVLTSTFLARSAIALSVSTVSTMGTVIVQPAQMKANLPATLAFLGARRTRHATKITSIDVSIGPSGARIVPSALLPPSWLNDNVCDCQDCSDEEAWDCSNCSSGCRGCVNEKAVNCFGQQFNLNFSIQCPGYPAHPGSPAMKLGCAINYTALNDNNCDCPSCSCGVF